MSDVTLRPAEAVLPADTPTSSPGKATGRTCPRVSPGLGPVHGPGQEDAAQTRAAQGRRSPGRHSRGADPGKRRGRGPKSEATPGPTGFSGLSRTSFPEGGTGSREVTQRGLGVSQGLTLSPPSESAGHLPARPHSQEQTQTQLRTFPKNWRRLNFRIGPRTLHVTAGTGSGTPVGLCHQVSAWPSRPQLRGKVPTSGLGFPRLPATVSGAVPGPSLRTGPGTR